MVYIHCRKTLLFFQNKNEAWVKKTSHDCFDIPMGSYDGAEICELVGLLILNNPYKTWYQKTTQDFTETMALSLLQTKEVSQPTKYAKKSSNPSNLSISKSKFTGLPSVDFLDVTLNLKNGTFKPLKKPNDSLLYVHMSSSHPPQQIPTSIAGRLSNNSFNKTVFIASKACYEDALKTSGFPDIKLS